MKTFPLVIGLAAFIGVPNLAVAASGSLSEFVPKVLPVLVQVDSDGKVTSVSPAKQLPPKLGRLLRANLDEMISAPAVDKKGRATSSQFVINLALQTSPRPDGDFDVVFAYVSTSPVPAGSWYWVHTDGRELALARQSSRNLGQYSPSRYDQPTDLRGQDRSSMPNISNIFAPSPAAVMGPATTSAPDPGRDH